MNEIKNKGEADKPVREIADLLAIVLTGCFGTIDSSITKEKDSSFPDELEFRVGHLEQQVTQISERFNADAVKAAKWLKRQRGGLMSINTDDDETSDRDEDILEPSYVDQLLEIEEETCALDDIHAIKECLQELMTVLTSQSTLMRDFIGKAELASSEKLQARKSFRVGLNMIDTKLKDFERMDDRLVRLATSVTTLLDSKHRYANLFEARFSRYQATATAHQGQTIMVFTIVTIIFLPLSFIATLFSINITNFPQGEGGEPNMSLGFVSQWVFGIGFAISIPLIITALNYETMMTASRQRIMAVKRTWKQN